MRIKRDFEPSINCLNSTGLPQPLKRINRVPKHDTTALIPSDGFNEMKTTAQTDLLNPKVHKIQEKPILSMIHKYNIAELALVDRPVRGPETGFGTVVNKHPQGHDKLWRDTSSGIAHGVGQKLSAAEQQAAFALTQEKQGGLRQPRPFVEQGVKCMSGLTGEIFKQGDPKEQTEIQRAWLYPKDASLVAMQKGKTDQTLKQDNELSLPLGDGERAGYKFSSEPGYYRHKRCDITIQKNNIITRK